MPGKKNFRVHLGFMAEELSAKLKPHLLKRHKDTSIVVITRDNFDEQKHVLFEQPVFHYDGLQAVIQNKDFFVTNLGKESDCRDDVTQSIGLHVQNFLDFSSVNYNLPGAKTKLGEVSGQLQLSVVRIGEGGNDSVEDVYLQFPEMGAQSNSPVKLVNSILDGIFFWLGEKRANSLPSRIIFDAFGAGGSVNPDLKPGSQNDIAAVFRLRRFLRPNNTFRSKLGLRFFSSQANSSHVWTKNYYRTPEMPLATVQGKDSQQVDAELVSLRSQEAAILANFKLAGLDFDHYEEGRIVPLSPSFIGYLQSKHPGYKGWYQKKQALHIQAKSTEADVLLMADQVKQKKIEGDSKLVTKLIEFSESLNPQIECFDEKMREVLEVEKEKIRAYVNCDQEEILNSIRSDVKDMPAHSVSFSASLFSNHHMKLAVQKVLGKKVSSVNMEDDLLVSINKHVQKILRKKDFLKEIPLDFRCARVHCDPYQLPQDCANKFKAWVESEIRKTSMECDYYIDAIFWVASGFNQKFLTDHGCWKLPDFFKGKIDKSKYFYFTKNNKGKPCVVDPFWREVGTDMLADLSAGKWFADKNAPSAEKVKFLASALMEVLYEWENSEKWIAAVKKDITFFLDILFKELEFRDQSGSLKVWVRKGSWYGNSEGFLEDLDSSVWGSVADRAFYTSTNIVALQEKGEKRINDLFSEARKRKGSPVNDDESIAKRTRSHS